VKILPFFGLRKNSLFGSSILSLFASDWEVFLFLFFIRHCWGKISSDERKTKGKKRKMSVGFPGINSSKRNDNSQIVETEQKRMFWQSPLS